MPGLIEVTDGGIGNTIQDTGRTGFRHMGLSVSGYLDPYLARCANALVGNRDADDCACVEIRAVGPRLLIREGPVRLALAGEIGATLYREGEDECRIAAWQSVTALVGDEIEFDYLPGGSAYLAVEGGIDLPAQLNSRSTYQRAQIGGVGGEPISTGHLLPCAEIAAASDFEYEAAMKWSYNPKAPLRIIPGPQDELFRKDAFERFVTEPYQVTRQIDRMGVRLEGPVLTHIDPSNTDIVSDAVTPGSIQVPGDGMPIVLLADCQTVGGYPKIATVIRADLPRLGQARPDDVVCFRPVTLSRARLAFLETEARWGVWARFVKRVGVKKRNKLF